MRRGVRDAERAVYAAAITQRLVLFIIVILMAIFAHVVRAEATVEGGGAAVHAFPVNLIVTVLLASLLTGTDLL